MKCRERRLAVRGFPLIESRNDLPVPVDQELKVGAEIVKSGGRSAVAEATIQDDSGFLLAHARAECVHVRPEYFLSTPQGKARGTDWLPT